MPVSGEAIWKYNLSGNKKVGADETTPTWVCQLYKLFADEHKDPSQIDIGLESVLIDKTALCHPLAAIPKEDGKAGCVRSIGDGEGDGSRRADGGLGFAILREGGGESGEEVVPFWQVAGQGA